MQIHEFEGVLRAAQAGADWAWSRLHDAYAGRILGYLRSRGAGDPEGLLGDVLLQVARNVATFEGGESEFRSWLFLIAHNRIIDERRRRGRRPEQELHDAHHPTVPSAEQGAFDNMSLSAAMEVMESLTDEQREVLALRVIAGLSLEETSVIMDKNINAIKQLQHRAINSLRKRIPTKPVTNHGHPPVTNT